MAKCQGCGQEIRYVEGEPWSRHLEPSHWSRVNRRKGAKRDDMGLTGKESPEQVLAALQRRDEELRDRGVVG